MTFQPHDYIQMADLGINVAQVEAQLRRFTQKEHLLEVDRPCTVGDGIVRLRETQVNACLEYHRQAAQQGRLRKFVPASGAASRMFQGAVKCHRSREPLHREGLTTRAAAGDPAAQEVLHLMDNLPRLALFADLAACLSRQGCEVQALLAAGDYRPILDALLSEAGLHCAAQPKALLKFHAYPESCRTACEEHLVEAAHYVKDRGGICRVHFTVPQEAAEGFHALLAQVQPQLESLLACRFEVAFSQQKPSTNTIAADPLNQPLRDPQGRLVFRPGGHGALLENLQDLDADIVYIKNIDNITPDRLKEPGTHWKKVLGGYLALLQEEQHRHLQTLEEGYGPAARAEILAFLVDQLGLNQPPDFGQWPAGRQRDYLWTRLYRPLRVCGMVRNTGEPGGGPFWVRDAAGEVAPQIVEASQLDLSRPGQRAAWEGATHFNPVDLVCALRDYRGRRFDLHAFTDPRAVFISRKSDGGRTVQALELPGLWNGAMAGWLSVFVEVPLITFNPVKTILDLLRPEHQSE